MSIKRVSSILSRVFIILSHALYQSVVAEPALLAPAPENHVMSAQATTILQQEASGGAVKSVLVAQADAAALGPSTRQMKLELARNVAATIVELRAEDSEAGPIAVWHGRVQAVRNADGTDSTPIVGGEVILAVNGSMISGTVRYGSTLYKIVPLGGRDHAIVELDTGLFPEDKNDAQVTPSEAAADGGRLDRTSSPIRILVVMSNSAQVRIADPQGLARLMFAEANQGLENSGLAVRFELAGILPISYHEEGGEAGFHKALSDMVGNTEIRSLRQAHFADVVLLMVTNASLGGVAYLGTRPDKPYAALSVGYATGNYVFAHEIGHVIGADHEGTGNGHHHGYQQGIVTPYWRTIMAYECSPRCPRVNYFSDPDRRYLGLPMGVSGNSENTRVIRVDGPYVAAYVADPSPTYDFHITGTGGKYVYLKWYGTADSAAVAGYEVRTNNINPQTTTARTLTMGPLDDGMTHTFQLRSYDADHNYSAPSTLTYTVPDLTPPSPPENFRVTTQTSSSVTLEWNPTTDNVGVKNYRVETSGVPGKTATATKVTFTGLPSGQRTFNLNAFDAAGNGSGTRTLYVNL